MRKGLLGSITALAASAGLAQGQPPSPMSAPYPPAPMSVAPAGPSGALAALPPADGFSPFSDAPYGPPGLLNQMLGGGGTGLSSERGWATFNTNVSFIRTMPAGLPLITAGTTLSGGVIPNIGTTTTFSVDNFNVNPLMGGSWETGYWLRRNSLWGLSWAGFVTELDTDRYRIAPNNQVVARPFIDADSGLPNSLLIGFPGFLSGDITASVSSQLWGSEWLLHRKLFADEFRRLSFQLGFRYFDIYEDLAVSSSSVVQTGSTINFYNLVFGAGARIDVRDRFETRNQYMLGQLGMQGNWRYRRWLFEWATRVGLGGVYQTLNVQGNSSVTPAPGAATNTVLGGLFAVDTNIGRYHSSRFAVVPEGKIQVAYRFVGNLDLGLGYTFTYFNSVIRPSEQIDPNISTTRVPASANYAFPGGAVSPTVTLNRSDMWIQGLNFFASLRY
jgi:hypothetical protein